MSDLQPPYSKAIQRMAKTFSDASSAVDPEAALAAIGQLVCDILGDKTAASQPGSLKPGETDFTISGYLNVRPEGTDMILIAETGWPADQHRLIIEIDEGRPGWVVGNATPLVLPNTDDDGTFTQILSSARMGSSMYAPLMWQGSALGLITVASQARNTYGTDDLPLLQIAAAHAASLWIALGGNSYASNTESGQFLPKNRNHAG
jgi:hypothetical protein